MVIQHILLEPFPETALQLLAGSDVDLGGRPPRFRKWQDEWEPSLALTREAAIASWHDEPLPEALVLAYQGKVEPMGSDRLGRLRKTPNRHATDLLIEAALKGDTRPLQQVCKAFGTCIFLGKE